jgi:glutamate-1-semialdehyde 2,1-aminomutase
LIEQHGPDLAAVIVEPLMGAGGCIPGDPVFLRALRDATARAGTLLIFDEVMTSRLAPGGLQESHGITPDMTTFGKYLGGGMSFGAFGGRRQIMERFDPSRPDALPHSGTYNNNVLTMAAGAAGLREVFTAEEAVRLNEDGERLKARLNALAEAKDLPLHVSGTGSILGLHLQRRPVVTPSDTAETRPEARALVHLELLDRGVNIARRGFMSLSLPLTSADHDTLVAAVEEILSEYGDLIES